jgi:hypothetical protein
MDILDFDNLSASDQFAVTTTAASFIKPVVTAARSLDADPNTFTLLVIGVLITAVRANGIDEATVHEMVKGSLLSAVRDENPAPVNLEPLWTEWN